MKSEICATGFAFPEGPCVDRSGVLYVVELATGRISRVVDRRREDWAILGGSPNGAAFGPDGCLYVCNGGGRWPAAPSTGMKDGPGGERGLIQRLSPDKRVETIIDDIEGLPLNSPNDICFDQHGAFYFTDPGWDTPNDGAGGRIGDVCYSTRDGRASRIHHGLQFPNGLHVTPDGKALLVDETDTGRVLTFPIIRPGCLGPPGLYIDLGSGSGPDGMCLDSAGRLIIAGSNAGVLFVVAPGGGATDMIIELEDPCPTNVCFGGPGYRTLFVTEAWRGYVESIRWEVPGMVLFPDRGHRTPVQGAHQ